jgi:hypothetical protein
MSDWIVALTIRDFVERHLATVPSHAVEERQSIEPARKVPSMGLGREGP